MVDCLAVLTAASLLASAVTSAQLASAIEAHIGQGVFVTIRTTSEPELVRVSETEVTFIDDQSTLCAERVPGLLLHARSEGALRVGQRPTLQLSLIAIQSLFLRLA